MSALLLSFLAGCGFMIGLDRWEVDDRPSAARLWVFASVVFLGAIRAMGVSP